jgi:hypothetical protein
MIAFGNAEAGIPNLLMGVNGTYAHIYDKPA